MAVEVARTGRASNPLHGSRWRATRVLGRGAASEVLEAVGGAGELRAVKLLRGAFPPAGQVAQRFAQEARTLAALRHPNVVPVLEAGVTASGRPFLVMPRLVGETLRDRLLRRARLPAPEACELLAGALDGLELAHAHGIIHRDVKPANVFLVARPAVLGSRRARERAVVLDFGIAKVESGVVDPTTGAHVLGTPRYLAPEQVLGGEVDPRTDVYAMGVVLYEAIAGRAPFIGSDEIALMRAHLEEEPPPLSRFVDVPADVEAVIGRALEKPPARRWPSARTFAEALRAAARRGEP